MKRFRPIDKLLSFISSFPAGNYLIAQDKCYPHSVSLSQGVDTSAEPANSPPPSIYDISVQLKTPLATSDAEYILPEWIPLCNRIPYTFRQHTYCASFFLSGACNQQLDSGALCPNVHLKRPNLSKSAAFTFLNCSKSLQRSSYAHRGTLVRPTTFTFCQDAVVPEPLHLNALLQCPNGETCTARHLSMHQILERMAEQVVREERMRTRVQKKRNVWKRKRECR